MGTEGDFRPAGVFCRALLEKGHQVDVVCPPNAADFFSGENSSSENGSDNFNNSICISGLRIKTFGMDTRTVLSKEFGASNSNPLKTALAMWRYFPITLEEQTLALEELFSETSQDYDLVLASGLFFSAIWFAEKYRLPYFHIAHVCQVIPSPEHPPFAIPFTGLPHLVNRMLWAQSNLTLRLFITPKINKIRKTLNLPPLKRADKYYSQSLLIAMDRELSPLPKSPLNGVNYFSTPYWFEKNSFDKGISTSLNVFLEEHKGKVVYIGFGSMSESSESLKFFQTALEMADLYAVVSQGWAQMKSSQSLDRIFLTPPVDHRNLFPRLEAAVHHGGAGTTYTSALFGLPQWIFPHMLDQYYWARRIQTLGLGPRSGKIKPGREAKFAETLKELVRNSYYKENCRSLAQNLNHDKALTEHLDILNQAKTPQKL
jgi:UDP:flavonoid glycosyltransferase YjiC (YdhE family)